MTHFSGVRNTGVYPKSAPAQGRPGMPVHFPDPPSRVYTLYEVKF